VKQIELAGAFENMRGVQQLPDLRIDRWIFGIRPRANVEGDDQGVRFRRLKVDKDGEFRDQWPQGFFEERARELF